MMQEKIEDDALEDLLHELRPSAPVMDGGAMLFRAGQASARAASRRQLALWRTAAGVLLSGLGLTIAFRSAPAPIDRVRVVYRPAARQAAPEIQPARSASAADPTPAISGASSLPTDASFIANEARASIGGAMLVSVPGAAAALAAPALPSPDADYLTLRSAVLHWGVRAMPAPPRPTPVRGPPPQAVDGVLALYDLRPSEAARATGANLIESLSARLFSGDSR